MTKEETIYHRVAKLEDEAAALSNELDIIKKVARNEIARYEIKMIKKGNHIDSIID